jgi:type II secretory pathway predicted ATPase ExeA
MTPAAPWLSHFGLTRVPFSKSIPADKLFERPAHQEAVARVHFCIQEAALGVIIGDVGAGKTVAVRAATSQLDRTRHHLIYVPAPTFGSRGLYVTIVTALGSTPRFHKAEVMAQTHALLAAEEQERHRRVVLALDLCRSPNYADTAPEVRLNRLRSVDLAGCGESGVSA